MKIIDILRFKPEKKLIDWEATELAAIHAILLEDPGGSPAEQAMWFADIMEKTRKIAKKYTHAVLHELAEEHKKAE